MKRLTTDKPNGMYELAHNGCYIDENLCARYRDYETDIDARELTRDIMRVFGLWEIDDNEMLSDEVFDDTIMENLMYGTKELEGLIALFYRNLWAMAELRERLKHYEDLEEQGKLIVLPCKVGDVVYYECPYSTCVIGVQAYQITNVMISQNKKGEWTKKYRAMRLYNGKTIDSQINFSFDDIGKTVFLTEKEAKLQELQNGVKQSNDGVKEGK